MTCIFPSYSICLRQELGFCCVNYAVCNDDGITDPFSLDTDQTAPVASKIDSDCTKDYIGISGKVIMRSK